MSLFPVFQTTASGLHANRVWMDAVADNMANMNTVSKFDQPAFQARFVQVAAKAGDGSDPVGVGGGVDVTGVQYGSAEGQVRYDPTNPLANDKGLVRYPDIDLSDQMTQLMQAQRSYQLNLTVIDRARESYQQAIQIQAR